MNGDVPITHSMPNDYEESIYGKANKCHEGRMWWMMINVSLIKTILME